MTLPAVDPDFLRPAAAIALDISLVRDLGLHYFVRTAWRHLWPGMPFVNNWHIEALCEHLQAVSRGEIDRLIINVPPGSSKSSLCSVLWPAWDWIAHPSRNWIVCSVDDKLCGRDSNNCKRLLKSKWYQDRWGKIVGLDESGDVQETQHVWHTTKHGRRVSATVAGGIIGWHGDINLVDDPTKPTDIKKDPGVARDALERTWEWYSGTLVSRRTGQQHARVIIMQRLHELDLVGRILEADAVADLTTGRKTWVHVMFPMRFEKDRACTTPWGKDPRTDDGALLCPARWDDTAVKELEKEMGGQVAAAQLQQRPAPAGGNVFKREWFAKKWMRADNPKWALIAAADRDRYVVLPRFFSGALSVDCAFKDVAGADNTALLAAGESEGKFYILDCIADRMDLNTTVRCIEALSIRYPFARAKLIEDKANGPAVEQTMRKTKGMSGIIMITPEGGKVARANAVSPLCEAGDVIVADESEGEWVSGFVEEVVTFPFARRDDRCDAFTQLLNYLHGHSMAKYIIAMQKVASGEFRWAGTEE